MRWWLVLSIWLLMGTGCVPNLPFTVPYLNEPAAPVIEAEDLDLKVGSKLVIEQTWLGFTSKDAEAANARSVVIEEWLADSVRISWSKPEYRETAASKEARKNAAANIGIGEAAVLPEAVYENVIVSGSIQTDALTNAERILLPAYWPEGEYNAAGQENSLVWLSEAQYDELVNTRSSHIQLGLFDSTLQDLVDFTEGAKGALDRLQGKIADSATTNKDFTKLTAKADWGSYVLKVDGTEVQVKTIEAANAFAHYTILANRDNPLILEVSLRPWAFGPGMFTSLKELSSVVGYKVTELIK